VTRTRALRADWDTQATQACQCPAVAQPGFRVTQAVRLSGRRVAARSRAGRPTWAGSGPAGGPGCDFDDYCRALAQLELGKQMTNQAL
jgi:hypothetical protein